MRRIVAWLQRQGAQSVPHRHEHALPRLAQRLRLSPAAAAEHGFTHQALGAPVIIADGLRGTTETRRSRRGPARRRSAAIGREFVKADALLLGRALQGTRALRFRRGAQEPGHGLRLARRASSSMHSTTKPYVRDGCIACGVCVVVVSGGRHHGRGDGGRSTMRDVHRLRRVHRRLPGRSRVGIRWNESTDIFQMKMVEYAQGHRRIGEARAHRLRQLHHGRPSASATATGPTKSPIVPDVGVVASLDPVAVDQASYDLVNAAPVGRGRELSDGYRRGSDKFRDLHPDVDPTVQLRYAEELGLGTQGLRTRRHQSKAPVAQLDRALDSGSRGRRFESSRAYHLGTGRRRQVAGPRHRSIAPVVTPPAGGGPS